MTNGPGKSDRPVVPEKSPNKAGQPVAEGMEGRGLAKGNLPQQNASRTPSRKDAPSALERVGSSRQCRETYGVRVPFRNCSFRTDSIPGACGGNDTCSARM